MLTPWKKSHDQPKHRIKKQRHYFANKGPSSQSYGCSSTHVWMWELDYKDSWAPKNWCFELWCWRKLLRVPWTMRRSNQSILKEICPEYSLEYSTAEDATPILWSPDAKICLIWKDPQSGKAVIESHQWWLPPMKAGEGDDRGWDGWLASLTQWTWVWVNFGSWRRGRPSVLQSMGLQRVGYDWVTELNWTETCINTMTWKSCVTEGKEGSMKNVLLSHLSMIFPNFT